MQRRDVVFHAGRRKPETGFSLVQATVMLTIFSLMLTAILPGGEQNSPLKKAETSLDRMKVIEDTLNGFYAAYGRIPCPADGTKPMGDTNYGAEAANQGTCTGGTPAANFSTSTVVAGMLPVKTLGLENKFAQDGFGHHTTYVVDAQFTSACSAGTATSAINLTDDAASVTHPPYLLISHGEDGHGAYIPRAGTSGTGTRLSKGTTVSDADTIDNASVNAAFANNFDVNFVKKSKTPAFDDIVDKKALPTSGPTVSPEYLAVAQTNSPYLNVFKLCGTSFTSITAPTLPSAGLAVRFSHDNTYILTAHQSGNRRSLYRRSGASAYVAASPGVASTASYSYAAEFSSTSTHLVTGAFAGINFAQNTATDSYTAVASWSPATETAFQNAEYAPNDLLIGVTTSSTSPYFKVYKSTLATNTYTALTGGPAGITNSVDMMWFPGSSYVLINTGNNAPYAHMYSINAGAIASATAFTDVFTRITTGSGSGFDTLGVQVSDFAYSPDSGTLAVSHLYTPWLALYQFNAGTPVFTRIATNPNGAITANGGQQLEFSKDGTFLAVTLTSSPWFVIYKRSGSTPYYTAIGNPTDVTYTARPFDVDFSN